MLWVNTFNIIKQAANNYTSRQQLALLSDEQLKDIDITREEAKAEANKSSILEVIKVLFYALKTNEEELQWSNEFKRG
jgi:uncharacterized protein YjiS (DUF1127 family)